MDKPDFVTEEHLKYLDALRESAETNMAGAGPYLDDNFPELNDGDIRSYRSSKKARAVLAYWMKTFGERHAKV